MTNATHRLLWTVIALLLITLGAFGLMLSLGEIPGTDPTAPLLGPAQLRWWREATPVGALGVAVGGLLAALLGYRLIEQELRAPDDPATGGLIQRNGGGRTRLPAGVLARALERDLVRDPGVCGARVVLTGAPPRPDLWIQLEVDAGARTAGVREHVGTAVRRFTVTSGLQPAHLDVTARFDRREGS